MQAQIKGSGLTGKFIEITNAKGKVLTADKVFDSLAAATKYKLMRRAATRSLQHVKKKAQQKIPVGKKIHKTYRGNMRGLGYAKRSIVVRGFKKKSDNFVLAAVGVKKEAFYAVHFVELGYRAGENGKFVRARPWLSVSYNSQKMAVVKTFKKILVEGIKKEAMK